jgi:hypothetical protein
VEKASSKTTEEHSSAAMLFYHGLFGKPTEAFFRASHQ